jgi:hypothetical protein
VPRQVTQVSPAPWVIVDQMVTDLALPAMGSDLTGIPEKRLNLIRCFCA